MLLTDVFEELHFGELSQLRMGDQSSAAIAPTYYPRIIRFINLALLDLYKLFPIREKEVQIQMYGHITSYKLIYDYAESNTASTQPYKYIKDLNHPFQDDVLQVIEAYNELGEPLVVNDINNDFSIYTPEEKVVQIPFPVQGSVVSCVYRTYPPKIDPKIADPTGVIVDLPEQLLTALLAYVGYRAEIGVPQGKQNTGLGHFKRYRAITNEIKELGTINTTANSNEGLLRNGWV